ncbi:MAG: serine hydrolase [Gemmatimonadales bacterium]|jgi:CubicO group peptidase (beta-lactamase class C family)
MGRLTAAVLVLATGFSFAVVPSTGHAIQPPPDNAAVLDDIDAYIGQAMEEWKIPGLAIAVVQDGEVILSKGYGYRDLDEQLPVTASTLFAIGSISKSFTVTLLGMLEDEGKVDWDEPVRRYLPDFVLYDDVATEYMTPRDLVTHRSGLPRHDLLWYGSDLTRRDLYERLRYIEPNREFREVFQYQNLMFMTAGYLAGQIEGKSWEALVRERVFEPLAMSGSNFSVDVSQKSDDFSYPYAENDGVVQQIDFRNIDEVGPAGSINSSVEEMIRYVQLHINKGELGEEQILSSGNAEQMQMPQMAIRGTIQYDELGHTSYGMGFFVTSYRGRKLVHHGGGIDGFISLLSFIPSENVGMIVLTNKSGNNPVPTVVTRGVYDRVLGLDPVDWVGRVKEQQARAEEAEQEGEEEGGPVQGTSLSHELADYAGDYAHPAYGVVRIEVDGGNLRATFNDISVPLEHFHYDVFEIAEDPMVPASGIKVMFRYDKQGDIDELHVPLEPAVEDILFKRVANESMREHAFLEPFVGEYDLGGVVMAVALRGDDTLTLTVPGQPTYELVPTRGTSFDLKGLSGYSAEFRRDETGAVSELVLAQPNGTFVAQRK